MTATVGIRLEDKSAWERRAPLVPDDVAQLVHGLGIRFLVEPSLIRVYGDDSYRAAGAEVGDLDAADVIFAVKEIPLDKVQAGKTYACFAHVIKGQAQNMPLLQRFLDLGCTLIDYERVTDESGRRLVLFGYQAGQAGMIETLHALGHRLAWEGHDNPLATIEQPYLYPSLAAAKEAIATAGETILQQGIPLGDGPLVVGFAGKGHTSAGAQEILDLLPFEEIAPESLPTLAERAAGVRDRVFKTVFHKHHLVTPRTAGHPFDETEYLEHPERYRSRLVRDLPHLTVLVNCIYWTPAYPRLLTRRQAADLWKAGARKLRVIGDITCDIDGAIELTARATQPDAPTYVYDPLTNRWTDGVGGVGIVVLAVDNLPCELPREASDQFSSALLPFLPTIADADFSRPFSELALPPEIKRAVITHQGALTPDYRHLAASLASAMAS